MLNIGNKLKLESISDLYELNLFSFDCRNTKFISSVDCQLLHVRKRHDK